MAVATKSGGAAHAQAAAAAAAQRQRKGPWRVVQRLLRRMTWVHWAGVVGLAVVLLGGWFGGQRFLEGVDEAEVRTFACLLACFVCDGLVVRSMASPSWLASNSTGQSTHPQTSTRTRDRAGADPRRRHGIPAGEQTLQGGEKGQGGGALPEGRAALPQVRASVDRSASICTLVYECVG